MRPHKWTGTGYRCRVCQGTFVEHRAAMRVLFWKMLEKYHGVSVPNARPPR